MADAATAARILTTLRWHPFLTQEEVSTYLDCPPATVARTLRGLRGEGQVRELAVAADRPGRARVWYAAELDPATALGVSPLVPTAGHRGPTCAGEARPLLPRLEVVGWVRQALWELGQALAVSGPGRLVAWSDTPVLWPCPDRAERRPVWFDGAGVVSFPEYGDAAAPAALRPFLVLWDTGLAPLPTYAPLLRGLARAVKGTRRSEPACPAVLVICQDAGRLALLAEMVTQVWRETPVTLPLVYALHGDVLAGRGLAGLRWAQHGAPPAALVDLLRSRKGEPTLGPYWCHPEPTNTRRRLPDYSQQLDAPRLGADLALVTFSATDRRVLALCGTAPLATARQLAAALGLSHARVRSLCGELVESGVLEGAVPRGTNPRVEALRYGLTRWGVALLATAVRLAPETYRRMSGVYVLPEDAPLAERSKAFWDDLPHLEAHTAAYLAYRTSRGPDGAGRYSLADWRREGVAPLALPGYDGLAFTRGRERQALRPDAFVRTCVEGRLHAFFLEVDRGTEGTRALAEKMGAYARWQRRLGLELVRLETWRLPPIAVLTTTAVRMRTVLLAAGAHPELDVRVSSLQAFTTLGPFGCPWHALSGPTAPAGA